MKATPAARLVGLWDRLKDAPGGPWLFGRVIAYAIPYTGSVHPIVKEVRKGYARVELDDRRRVRNHLQSVHAIALANIGEFTGGLAMTATAPPNVRSILTRLEVEFVKKARGRLTAECHCEVPPVTDTLDHIVRTTVRNAEGAEVARVAATWRLSPV